MSNWVPPKMKQWIESQSKRRAAIPHPTLNSPYVIYSRESTNPFWQSRRKEGLDYVPAKPTINFKLDQVATFIKAAADYERTKEDKFLAKFYRGTNTSSRIQQFNELFQSKERYEEYNRRIHDILNNKQLQKNKDQSKHEYYTGMAPNLMSVFISYFNTHFARLLSETYRKLKTDDIDVIQGAVSDTIKQAILDASTQMANILAENANEYGDGEEWRPILEMLGENNGKNSAMDMFNDKLRQAIGETNISNLVESLSKKKRGGDARKIRTIINKDLANMAGRTASIGGSIVEVVMPLIANYINKQSKNKDGTITYSLSESFGSNAVMTDWVSLFTTSQTIDLGDIMEKLQEAMSAGDSAHIREVYKRLEQFYAQNNFDKELEELYTVFVNAKNYGIGADGRNYIKKYEGSFEELPYFLKANGVNVGTAQQFLNFAYNTGEGAVRAPYRDAFKQDCINALVAIAANMMFDDYETIGRESAGYDNTIHVYYLSGKYIPASTVLSEMAEAVNSAHPESWATVDLPNPIRDYGAEGTQGWIKGLNMPLNSKGKVTDATFKELLWKHWQDEYDEAKAASRWSVSFSLRIKALIGKD